MVFAADRVLRRPGDRVLALYPARALIQDQILKWKELLTPLGIPFGYIDGGVALEERPGILKSSAVVLMTPDVAHAWLLGRAADQVIADFLGRIRLLVLDEIHVYDGVFGTNMAYFLRRLKAIAGIQQCVSSTATIGDPEGFVKTMTGFDVRVLGPEVDGSPGPFKTVLLAALGQAGRTPSKQPASAGARSRGFTATVTLLGACTEEENGRFLAFGDSRRMVERLVAAVNRGRESEPEPDEEAELGQGIEDDARASENEPSDSDEDQDHLAELRLKSAPALPYRSGYEDEDRKAIQLALTKGTLRGVVSTSALELGLDIGDMDLVLLLTPAPTVKALWQRIGRMGRRRPGVCVILDPGGELRPLGELHRYLDRAIESNRLYLDNRYAQYTNALCAAAEFRQVAVDKEKAEKAFSTLPEAFRRFLRNELDPQEAVDPDLFPLKQRAQAGPHLEFPLRTGIERQFQVLGPWQMPLGSVTFSQAVREAYPGAVYYYMARPYRVIQFNFGSGELRARRERHYSTDPLLQRKAFPQFQGGLLRLWTAESGFVAEVEMQVSERVLGFTERRGSATEKHLYGPASPYFQRELNRFFETTGVAWWFKRAVRISEATVE